MRFLLAFVFILFAGIMVYVYVGAEQARPVILDAQGKPYASGRK
jgi:hypothetical protein